MAVKKLYQQLAEIEEVHLQWFQKAVKDGLNEEELSRYLNFICNKEMLSYDEHEALKKAIKSGLTDYSIKIPLVNNRKKFVALINLFCSLKEKVLSYDAVKFFSISPIDSWCFVRKFTKLFEKGYRINDIHAIANIIKDNAGKFMESEVYKYYIKKYLEIESEEDEFSQALDIYIMLMDSGVTFSKEEILKEVKEKNK